MEPPPHGPASNREYRRKRGGQEADATTGRRRVAHHDQPGHRAARPAQLCGDLRRQPSFAIERREHPTRIRDDGLHLDDEDGAEVAPKPDDVHRAAFAADREGHLDRRLPTFGPQHRDDPFDQCRVRRIEQPIQSLAVPPNLRVEVPADGCDHAFEDARLDVSDVSRLDAGHELSRDAGDLRHVSLPSTRADAKRPDGAADPWTIHRPIIASGAYRPPIRRSTPLPRATLPER